MSAPKTQKITDLTGQSKEKALMVANFLQEKKIKGLLTKETNFSLVDNDGFRKIKCKLSGHEMKPNMEIFKSYLASPKYLAMVEKHVNSKDFEPFLISHYKREGYLYCTMSRKTLICDKAVLARHTQGHKFARKLNSFYQSEVRKGHGFINKMQYCHRQIKKMDEILADPKTKPDVRKSCARKVKMFSKEYNNHSKRFSEAVTCRQNMKMVLACKVKLSNLRQAQQIAKGNLLPSK